MFIRACDRTAPKARIQEELLALAGDADQELSRSKAGKLAQKFKQGAFDPDLARILTYADPTGEQAVAPRREPTRHISDRRHGEPFGLARDRLPIC